MSDIRLTDLNPRLFVEESDGGLRLDATLAEAHGIMFDCPTGCGMDALFHFDGRDNPRAENLDRWTVSGTGFEDLTMDPALLVDFGSHTWRGNVTDGSVETCAT